MVLVAATLAAVPFNARAQVAPTLGTADNFAVLGGSTVTNTGPSVTVGDLGLSPGSAVTGFPPGLVTAGTIHAADAVALQAQGDATAAYLNLASQGCTTTYGVPTDIGGLTLVPGVYCFSSSGQLTGALTLDALGDPAAVWIFKTASTLTTASNASVLMTGGGQPCNVFWQVGSSAVLGTGTTFAGTIVALTSISLFTNASVSGRTWARNGAVTMDSNTVSVAVCAPLVVTVPPTLAKAFSPSTIDAGGISTLTITLSNTSNTDATLLAPLVDTLPVAVVIAGTALTTCNGTVTAALGGNTVTLLGGTIPAAGSCSITVDVTADSVGSYLNSLPIGALQTTTGANPRPATATLIVTSPPGNGPTLGKVFNPGQIQPGGTSTLTITLGNPGLVDAVLTAPLVDALPWGLVVASVPTTTCGGEVVADLGGSLVTLTGGVIPAGGSCTVTVDVTVECEGFYTNQLPAGGLQTSNGSNVAGATAGLSVATGACVARKLAKTFSPSTMDAGGTSTLTITLTNAKPTPADLIAPLIDTLPVGMSVASLASTTCGGAVTADIGGSLVTLVGGSVPANGSCTVTVDVTAACGGSYLNRLPANALQTSNGHNYLPADATLSVTGSTAACGGCPQAGQCSSSAGGTSSVSCDSSSSAGPSSMDTSASSASPCTSASEASSSASTCTSGPDSSTSTASSGVSTASSSVQLVSSGTSSPASSTSMTASSAQSGTSVASSSLAAPSSSALATSGTSTAASGTSQAASSTMAQSTQGSSGVSPTSASVGSSSGAEDPGTDPVGCHCQARPTSGGMPVLAGMMLLFLGWRRSARRR